jgi:hypothetical protein
MCRSSTGEMMYLLYPTICFLSFAIVVVVVVVVVVVFADMRAVMSRVTEDGSVASSAPPSRDLSLLRGSMNLDSWTVYPYVSKQLVDNTKHSLANPVPFCKILLESGR